MREINGKIRGHGYVQVQVTSIYRQFNSLPRRPYAGPVASKVYRMRMWHILTLNVSVRHSLLSFDGPILLLLPKDE